MHKTHMGENANTLFQRMQCDLSSLKAPAAAVIPSVFNISERPGQLACIEMAVIPKRSRDRRNERVRGTSVYYAY